MPSVLVLGAGPAGAAAALFLARRGHAVMVLDRDPISAVSSAESERESVPHARQGHTFLALGTRVLREEAPDLFDKLVQQGAQAIPLQHDPVHCNLLTRRSLFEQVLRSALLSEPGVTVVAKTGATNVLLEARSGNPVPHAYALATSHGVLEADLIIDAGGRRSPLPRWLRGLGVKLPLQRDSTTSFYLTRHYRLRRGAYFPSVRVPIVTALEYAAVVAFPEDDGHFQLTIQLDVRDPLKHRLRSGQIFERFLAQLPTVAPWLEAGTAQSEPEPVGSVGNCRRYLFHDAPVLTGVLALGDAAVCTNPTAGRGVALALHHARALARLLDDGYDAVRRPGTLSERWESTTTRLLGPWLQSQTQLDRDRCSQVRACLAGKPWRAANDMASRLATAFSASKDCPIVGAAGERLFNLLATPDEILRDRELLRRLLRVANGAPDMTRQGLPRALCERLVNLP
jgi:2-polyprenyl-6-methoxyphenol hydroxylase-like FAD-dependent oxidoreductase